MKTSCLQGNLNRACKQVSKALAKRRTLPITTHIKLEAINGWLHLTTTDLDMAITVEIGAMNEEDGSICVPGKLFSQLVAKAPKDSRFDLSTEDNVLIVKNGSSELRLSGMDSEDFPPIPDKFEAYATIEPDTLRDAIEQTAYCAADEDTRPVLQSVCFIPKNGGIEFAAADGFRLAVRIAYAETFTDKTILVRGDALDKISGFLKGVKSQVKVMYHEVMAYNNRKWDEQGNVIDQGEPYVQNIQAAFVIDHTTVICQCVMGTFPKYSVLIPLNHTTSITFDREALLSAVESVKQIAAESNGIVRLELEPQSGELGRLAIMAKGENHGEIRNEIDCLFVDELTDVKARRIAFNAKYLAEMLASLDCAAMSLEITEPSHPGLFRPVTMSRLEDNYQQIIMPMFVQWPEKPIIFDAWTDLMGATVGDYADSEPWDGLREPCHNCEDSDNVARGYVELNDGKCTDCGRQVTPPEREHAGCNKCLCNPTHGGSCKDSSDPSDEVDNLCGAYTEYMPADQQVAATKAEPLAVPREGYPEGWDEKRESDLGIPLPNGATFYTTPGHGFLRVDTRLLPVKLSSYDYLNGHIALLEEDCSLAMWLAERELIPMADHIKDMIGRIPRVENRERVAV